MCFFVANSFFSRLNLSLENPISLRVGAELEDVFAAFFKAEFFVKFLRPKIIFPHAEPENVVFVRFGKPQTFQHQRFADSFADVFVQGVKAAKLDWTLAGNAVFARIGSYFSVTDRFVFDFGDQINRA